MLRLLVGKRKLSQRHRQKLFIYWLVALVLIAAFFANILKFLSNFVSSWSRPTGSKLIFEKFEGEKITGVILGDSLYLATFDPVNAAVDVFEMPSNLYLEVPEKGFYLASRVYDLGDEENDGAKLAATTTMLNFSIPIDFYLKAENSLIDRTKIAEIANNISKPTSILWVFQIPKTSKISKTNLTLFDQFKLFWQLRKVRRDKFNYQLMESGNFEELILPNGEKVVKVSQDGLTPQTAQTFHDLKFAKENLTIAVFNAAAKPGLAQKVAKICQNLGGQCILGGESEEVIPETKILTKSGFIGSYTVKRLIKTFGGKIERQDSGLEDVMILAGTDLAKQLRF